MIRAAVLLVCLLECCLWAQGDEKPSYPSFDFDAAQTHEVKPHRDTIPVDGVGLGFNQLHLTLTVSATGDVMKAEAAGDDALMKHWPEVRGEVYRWRFTPFEKNGEAVTATVEEYVNLVPSERMPKKHVTPPVVRPDSKVMIQLERTACLGTCPAYTVAVSTEGVTFDGHFAVVAVGKHTDTVDADAVRALAKRFVKADFYSMNPEYIASVTDLPSHVLSISIDGQAMKVVDYAGTWVGMPEVVVDLEEAVDAFARTGRWVKGDDGLVEALRVERFDFQSAAAQAMLKAAAIRGQTATVREFLDAGVPLEALPVAKSSEPGVHVPYEHVGWLRAASRYPDLLQVLMDAGASKDDQADKDLALAGAADAGNVAAARELIAYGANPNADLSKLDVRNERSSLAEEAPGAGSILIYAAASGNPEMVREILRYHPKLEARDREGKTAMFAAGNWRYGDKDGARVECVRLLAEAGANVNARDSAGNTPLHETYLTDVEEELLKLGADVNAKNEDGETPIFTNVDNDAIPLFLEHGADLTIRNNAGETVVEAAKDQGAYRQDVLRKAIRKWNRQQGR